MLLYYITDRQQFSGNGLRQREQLLAKIAEAASAGIDYIQLRERDLAPRELEALAVDAVRLVREASRKSLAARSAVAAVSASSRYPWRTRLLINSRTDVALAVGADGVHLRSDDIVPSEARAIWDKCVRTSASALAPAEFVVAASCHSLAEVRLARAHGANFAVFAPVFEKATPPHRRGVGLRALREACSEVAAAANVEGVEAGHMPVLALGGVSLENVAACLQAGASGIAAIRLFQDHDIAEVVEQLRALGVRSS